MSAPSTDRGEEVHAPSIPQKAPGKRWERWILLLLLIIIAAFCTKRIVFSPLPRGAYPILSPIPWDRAPYSWLANGDLAYLTTNANGTHQVWYRKMDIHGPVDTARPGPELPKDILNEEFLPSPNERWVAYTKHFNTIYQSFVRSADGKTTRPLKAHFADWLPDSRSYFTTGTALIMPLDVSPKIKDPSSTFGDRTDFMPITAYAGGATLLLAGNPNTPAGQSSTAQATVPIRSVQAAHPETIQQTWEAQIPPGIDSCMVTASPDNRYLLWRVETQQTSPFIAWLQRLHVAWRGEHVRETNYLISDVYGRNLHPVCTNRAGLTCDCYPAWTPDSNHLSFVYERKLYIVPID